MTTLSLYDGDITTLVIDGIVNAANTDLLSGGGVCGVIHEKSGPELEAACRKLQRCEIGNAKITSGFKLPCRYVLHTVGPQRSNRKQLASCYRSCLDLAVKKGLKSLAFPCISTGIYGYPKPDAAEIAISTVMEWLSEYTNSGKINEIIFVTHTIDDRAWYKRILSRVLQRSIPPIGGSGAAAIGDNGAAIGGNGAAIGGNGAAIGDNGAAIGGGDLPIRGYGDVASDGAYFGVHSSISHRSSGGGSHSAGAGDGDGAGAGAGASAGAGADAGAGVGAGACAGAGAGTGAVSGAGFCAGAIGGSAAAIGGSAAAAIGDNGASIGDNGAAIGDNGAAIGGGDLPIRGDGDVAMDGAYSGVHSSISGHSSGSGSHSAGAIAGDGDVAGTVSVPGGGAGAGVVAGSGASAFAGSGSCAGAIGGSAAAIGGSAAGAGDGNVAGTVPGAGIVGGSSDCTGAHKNPDRIKKAMDIFQKMDPLYSLLRVTFALDRTIPKLEATNPMTKMKSSSSRITTSLPHYMMETESSEAKKKHTKNYTKRAKN
jgi:O-acetyl-ADP-ribose deacetylase (regulator of RNase III)